MLATNPMWPSMRWMHAASWQRHPVGALAGEHRLDIAVPLQAAFLRGRIQRVHTFSSRPFQRWPCLIRSGRAAEAEVEPAAVAVAEEAEPAEAEPEVEAEVAPAAVVRAVAVLEAVVLGEAVRAAPVEPEAREEAQVAALAEARAAALVVAVTILLLIISTTRPTTSRGQSSRHSRLRLRPISKFWLRWPRERAASRFSTPTTCWVDSSASGGNRTSSTFWGMCRATRRREAATR